MEDIEPGCEGAVDVLKRWPEALGRRDFDYLEQILAPDFQFTCSTDIIPGVPLKKRAFIEMDKHIYDSKIRFLKVFARRMEQSVITLVFAEVSEEIRGDLGPNMLEASRMSDLVNGHVFSYASAWRQEKGGQWVCFSHNVLGMVR
jgi:hypothetical protein